MYTPYRLVDREGLMALEEPAATISRIHPETTGFLKMLHSVYNTIWHHTVEDEYLNI
jgi:hypothetical protein